MSITRNMPGWRSKYGFKPMLLERRHHDIDLELARSRRSRLARSRADDRAELRRCVFGAILQYQSVDRALERLLEVDHLAGLSSESD